MTASEPPDDNDHDANDDGEHSTPEKARRGRAAGSQQNWFKGSGNPAGRPRKQKLKDQSTEDDAVLENGNRLVTLHDTHETVSVHELTLRAEASLGAKGNAYALKHSNDRFERAQEKRNGQIRDTYGAVQGYKVEVEAQLSRAAARGLPPPDVFPHPDNIVLVPLRMAVWIFGGMTPEEAGARVLLWRMKEVLERVLSEAERSRRPVSARSRQDLEVIQARLDKVNAYLANDTPTYSGYTPQAELVPPSRPNSTRLREAKVKLLKLPVIEQVIRDGRLAGLLSIP